MLPTNKLDLDITPENLGAKFRQIGSKSLINIVVTEHKQTSMQTNIIVFAIPK